MPTSLVRSNSFLAVPGYEKEKEDIEYDRSAEQQGKVHSESPGEHRRCGPVTQVGQECGSSHCSWYNTGPALAAFLRIRCSSPIRARHVRDDKDGAVRRRGHGMDLSFRRHVRNDKPMGKQAGDKDVTAQQ